MVDEIFDRTYQSGRADLHASIDRGFARRQVLDVVRRVVDGGASHHQ